MTQEIKCYVTTLALIMGQGERVQAVRKHLGIQMDDKGYVCTANNKLL